MIMKHYCPCRLKYDRKYAFNRTKSPMSPSLFYPLICTLPIITLFSTPILYNHSIAKRKEITRRRDLPDGSDDQSHRVPGEFAL